MEKFDGIKKRFGFGCMRLPTRAGLMDIKQFSRMTDRFLEAGFNYFDTARGYMLGRSEGAVRKALTSRYPRDAFVLTDKLSSHCFKKESDIPKILEAQLKDCGVDYFDFYLMHAQDRKLYKKYTELNAYEQAARFKREGKVKHVGLSFHDNAEILDKILTEHPEIEIVQIQFNYLDYFDESVESKKCYDVCMKHDKPVIVMEPVKGGLLAKLPEDAAEVFAALGDASPASYALRFAAGFEGVRMILSGMSDEKMLEENIGTMSDPKPLSDREAEALARVGEILRGKGDIACTACRYCLEGCPKHIPIPDLFACLNAKRSLGDKGADCYYAIHTAEGGRAKECLGCGACEKVCPQHLEIRKLLKEVSKAFD